MRTSPTSPIRGYGEIPFSLYFTIVLQRLERGTRAYRTGPLEGTVRPAFRGTHFLFDFMARISIARSY